MTGQPVITLLGGGKVNAADTGAPPPPHPTAPHRLPSQGQRVAAQLVPAGSEPDLNTTHGEAVTLETTVKFQITAAEREGGEKKQK